MNNRLRTYVEGPLQTTITRLKTIENLNIPHREHAKFIGLDCQLELWFIVVVITRLSLQVWLIAITRLPARAMAQSARAVHCSN